MGNPTLVIKAGEGVLVDVPYNATGEAVTVTLVIKPLKGRGKDRRRCEAFYNGRKANISRRPLEPTPAEPPPRCFFCGGPSPCPPETCPELQEAAGDE